MAGMIVVTDPGTYSAVYPALLHAAWNGATVADMIFPIFLLAMGVAISLSFAARLQGGAARRALATHVLVRTLLLFVLGLAVNGFPDYSFNTLRIPGVLQRIAFCYLAGGLVYLVLSRVETPEGIFEKGMGNRRNCVHDSGWVLGRSDTDSRAGLRSASPGFAGKPRRLYR